jgi:L-fuculose-phosphate aldolase
MPRTPSTAAEALALVEQACQALMAGGQDDMVWGHPSVRDPGGRGIWMKASGWGFEEIDAMKIVLVSSEGEVLDGAGRRHIEYPIHTEIMARRSDVGAVVHTHSDAANAFAALDIPLRSLSHSGSMFTYPEIPRFTQTGGLIKTRELGTALADALGDAPACLMPQHGVVTVGVDVPTAVMTAVLLDKACKVQLAAMAAGEVVRYGSEEDTVAKRADVWSEMQINAGWEYLVRKARSR